MVDRTTGSAISNLTSDRRSVVRRGKFVTNRRTLRYWMIYSLASYWHPVVFPDRSVPELLKGISTFVPPTPLNPSQTDLKFLVTGTIRLEYLFCNSETSIQGS